MEKEIKIPNLGTVHLSPESLKFNVLLLDDDPDFAQEAASRMTSDEVAVKIACNVEEATRIASTTRLHAVLADVILSPKLASQPECLQGDEWLVSCSKIQRDALRAVVSGYLNKIRDEQLIRKQGIRIVEKAAVEEGELYDEITRLARDHVTREQRRLQEYLENLALGCDSMPIVPPSISLEYEARRLLMDWHDETKSQLPADFRVQIGMQALDADQIQEELQKGSVIGQKILRMFIRDMRLRLGLKGEKKGGLD